MMKVGKIGSSEKNLKFEKLGKCEKKVKQTVKPRNTSWN